MDGNALKIMPNDFVALIHGIDEDGKTDVN
jgi:hypothetical protein